MNIRKSNLNDVDEILRIYDIARKFMRENGNKTQWEIHPNKDDLINDINKNINYVLYEDNIIYATFSFFIGMEETYNIIYDGSWVNDKEYGVLHKVASARIKNDMMKYILDFAFEKINNIKIDTHKDNKVMQHILEKNDFIKCGIIILNDETERIAYQKCI